MNLGWYKLMDRIIMVQDQLEMNVAKHQEIDKEFYDLIQEAQEKLSEAYQYAGEKFNDSCEELVMYKIEKLTVKNRCEIPVGGVVEIEVNEDVKVHSDLGKQCYGQFYLRKCLAKKGLLQCVNSPFPANWKGKPLIVVKNDDVAPIELRVGDELGEVWVFTS